MGKAVVCGGKARFTPFDTVYQPASREAFREQTERLLNSETPNVPGHFRINARRFMYYHLFCASLAFYGLCDGRPTKGRLCEIEGHSLGKVQTFPLSDA